MFIVDFGLCGFSIKKGTLFGRGEYNLTSVRLGVATIFLMREKTRWFFFENLRKMDKISEYHITQSDEFKEALARHEDSATKDLEKMYRSTMEDLKERNQKLHDKTYYYNNDLIAYRNVIKNLLENHNGKLDKQSEESFKRAIELARKHCLK